MPVLLDSTSSGNAYILGGATSGSKTLTHNVSSVARDRKIALVWVGWTGEVNATSATWGVTFGGTSMTQIGSVSWDSNKGLLRLYKLEDVTGGSKSVVASFSGMSTELVTRNLYVVCHTYSGVDEVSSIFDEGASEATANSVVVDSVRAAHRVASGHMVGKLMTITAYNQTRRGSEHLFGGGQLVTGDAPGAETVTCTATNSASTDEWGALAVAMTPSVVEVTATRLSQPHSLRAAVSLLRVAIPHPDREYVVRPPDPASQFVAENFIRNPSGVWMPVWTKDTNDTLEYTLHFDHYLADDDEIASVQHTASGSLRVLSEFPGDMTDDTAILGKSSTQVWLSGGTANVTHSVRVRIATKRGRQHDFTFFVAGVEN